MNNQQPAKIYSFLGNIVNFNRKYVQCLDTSFSAIRIRRLWFRSTRIAHGLVNWTTDTWIAITPLISEVWFHIHSRRVLKFWPQLRHPVKWQEIQTGCFQNTSLECYFPLSLQTNGSMVSKYKSQPLFSIHTCGVTSRWQ